MKKSFIIILSCLFLYIKTKGEENFSLRYNKYIRSECQSFSKLPREIDNSFMVKMPTLMILPSDNWCVQRYYTTKWDNQGLEVTIPDYTKAFQEDSELGAVISKVGELLSKRGYSLKDAEQELRALNQRQAENNVTLSKNNGYSLSESPLDILKRRAKADILIQIWWKINRTGADKSASFTLEAFDTYTSKRIGTSSGTCSASNEIVPVLLENAVKKHIVEFDKQLQSYYKDIVTNGREIVFSVKKWDDWESDLETEFEGYSLLEIIEEWLHQNTLKGVFNTSDATENFATFEQVRIPLHNESGRSIDARTFISQLQRYLKSKYGIPSKVMTRGLGEANLILGEQ